MQPSPRHVGTALVVVLVLAAVLALAMLASMGTEPVPTPGVRQASPPTVGAGVAPIPTVGP